MATETLSENIQLKKGQLQKLKYQIDYYEEKFQFNNKYYKQLKIEYGELEKQIEQNMKEEEKMQWKEKQKKDKSLHEMGKFVDEMQLKSLQSLKF